MDDHFVLDEKNAKKSVKYNLEKIKNGIVYSVTNYLIILSLSIVGFKHIESFSASLFDSYVLSGLLFFFFLWILFYIVSLIFLIYSTFVTEKRFDFSNTTLTLFLVDQIKETLLIFIFGGFILTGLLWIIHNYDYWWIIVIIGSMAITLFINWIYPLIIIPIFYKMKSIADTNIGNKIKDISEHAGFEVTGIFVIDYSKRSKHSNALIAGFGKSKRIILYDTLLEDFEDEEILAIFAHEMGHYINHDILKSILTTFSILSLSIVFIWYLISSDIFVNTFDIRESYTELIYAFILSSTLINLARGIINSYSRKREIKADRYSVECLNSVEPLKNALKKLYKINLSNINPHPLYSKYYYSHPTPAERIEHIDALKNDRG
ncbi:MAG: M48 family metallopeptidase [Elusimicrobiota bacterium]